MTAEEIKIIGDRRTAWHRCTKDDQPFRNADAREADLSGRDWSGEDFSGCDLRGANLSGSTFAGASFHHADLWNADLRDSDLSGALHLLPAQFAATDLTRAKLPAEVPRFEALDTVQSLSENASRVFFTLLLAVVYTFLTMATTKDLELITNSNTTELPIIKAQISIVSFYIATPVVLLAFFIYFHLFLQRLWEAVAELPAIFPNGRRLDAKIYPWLMNDLARQHFPRLRCLAPPLAGLQSVLSILLGYWLIPLTLVAVWCKFIRVQNQLVTSEHTVLIAIAIGCSVYFARLLEGALSSREGKRPWHRRITCWAGGGRGLPAGLAVLLVFGAFSYGVLTAPIIVDYRTFHGVLLKVIADKKEIAKKEAAKQEEAVKADVWLAGKEDGVAHEVPAEQTKQPANLDDPDLSDRWQALQLYLRPRPPNELPVKPLQRWAPHLLTILGIKSFSSIPEAVLATRPADWVDAPGNRDNLSRVDGRNFKLFSFQHLRASRAFFAKAEFTYTDLRGAHLDDAELRGATIESAPASDANFTGAHFVENRLNPTTNYEDMHWATLTSVDFSRACFNQAFMNQVPITMCNLTGARFFGARCSQTKFTDCTLSAADFSYADCDGAQFLYSKTIADPERDTKGCTTKGAVFVGAHADSALFSNAILNVANFKEAILAHARFPGSTLYGADFTDADLSDADFSTATWLTAEQLRAAKTLYQAKLPPDLAIELKDWIGTPPPSDAPKQPPLGEANHVSSQAAGDRAPAP